MDDRMKKARSLAEERFEFLWHLAIYLVVNGGLVGVWAYEWLAERVLDFFWPVFPIVIWGLFVLSHFWSVYGNRERWIEAETARILGHQD